MAVCEISYINRLQIDIWNTGKFASSGNISDIYSGGGPLDSRPGHWLYRQVFYDFPQSLQLNARIMPHGLDCFPSTSIIRRYIVWAADSVVKYAINK
jgi:hypothetical protein